jgi:hypothetical protein
VTSNRCQGEDSEHGTDASNDQIDPASTLSLDPWNLLVLSSDFINVDGNHRDADSFVTSLNYNASSNQALVRILDAAATGHQHIPIWSRDLSTSNLGSHQQAAGIANNEWDIGRVSDVSIAPPAWQLASRGFDDSLSHVEPGFDQGFIPAFSSIDYPPVHSNAVSNSQPNPALQLFDFGVYNDFGVVPNQLASFNSFTQWDDSLAIDPQATMTSFNQLSPPITNSTFTTHAVPSPVASGMTYRGSNINTNPYTCDYPGCGKSFARSSDLVRHGQQHGVPQHPCLVDGCNRRGSKAFYRADKLRDHQRKKHRMTI